jgi:hypothetical protein
MIDSYWLGFILGFGFAALLWVLNNYATSTILLSAAKTGTSIKLSDGEWYKIVSELELLRFQNWKKFKE